jgi:polar amino acid transport system ATP-binding protein
VSGALRVRGLRLSRGDRVILSGVDLAANTGEVVALMGLSGSGKTTILRVLAGLERADVGDIEVPKAGMVFQFHFLFEHLTALDNVCLAPVHVQRASRASAEARARELLHELGVGHRERALPRELSGGEAQRVAIARALAMDPPVLLLDEPTASLDLGFQLEIGLLLQRLNKERSATMVMATHDLNLAASLCDTLVLMRDGRVLACGSTSDVLTSATVRQLYDVEADVRVHELAGHLTVVPLGRIG